MSDVRHLKLIIIKITTILRKKNRPYFEERHESYLIKTDDLLQILIVKKSWSVDFVE